MKYAQRGFRNKASKILRECPPKEQNQRSLNVFGCVDRLPLTWLPAGLVK